MLDQLLQVLQLQLRVVLRQDVPPQVELAKMTRKDEVKVKNLQTARHELSKVKERLVSLLDGGALHSDRDLCINVLKIIRQAIADMEVAQAAVDAIGQAKLKSKKSFGRR